MSIALDFMRFGLAAFLLILAVSFARLAVWLATGRGMPDDWGKPRDWLPGKRQP